jgi:hypothetical protein
MRVIVSFAFLFAVLLGGCARSDDSEGGEPMDRTNLHRMYLRDGSWLLINAPSPTDEAREGTLSVRVHRYPQGVGEKEFDKCIWIADRLSLVQYVPGSGRFYILAKETDRAILLFFTWNAQTCILDKETGKVVERVSGDNALAGWGSVTPVKLFIWGSATAYSYQPEKSTNDGDRRSPLDELFSPDKE